MAGQHGIGVLALDAEIESPRDLRGRKIGAPPRPSAVRLFTEALLRDGWGIIDEVEIDIRPPELMQAVAAGRIDATTWNLMSLTASGFVPLMPPLLESPGAHWVHVDEAAVAALADAGKLQVDTVQVGSHNEPGSGKPGTVTLLSFKQALAAWESTPTVVVNAILECLEGAGATSVALPSGGDAMLDWPMSDDEQLHAGALEFHRRRGALRERTQHPVIDR